MQHAKVNPACHNIANGINPGSNSKKTHKHAADCLKAVCLGVKVIYVRCINCLYIYVAKSIPLLNKKSCFVFTGKIHASKSF